MHALMPESGIKSVEDNKICSVLPLTSVTEKNIFLVCYA